MRVHTHLPIDSSCLVLQPCSPACLLLTAAPLHRRPSERAKANASEYADASVYPDLHAPTRLACLLLCLRSNRGRARSSLLVVFDHEYAPT